MVLGEPFALLLSFAHSPSNITSCEILKHFILLHSNAASGPSIAIPKTFIEMLIESSSLGCFVPRIDIARSAKSSAQLKTPTPQNKIENSLKPSHHCAATFGNPCWRQNSTALRL
jgi:hypothetical protein